MPSYVEREFEAYLKCGRLEHGFLRVRCETCHAEQLLAFSSPSGGASVPVAGLGSMAESAALLVDEGFPAQPVRQWVLSFPYPLRCLFASRPASMSHVLGMVYRCMATHLIKAAPAHPCARGISASLHVIACIEDPQVIKKISPTWSAKMLVAPPGDYHRVGARPRPACSPDTRATPLLLRGCDTERRARVAIVSTVGTT